MSARVLIVQDSKLLLVKAKNSPWHIPGGHLDEGENLITCAKREAYEETGYEVEIGDLIYCFEFLDKQYLSHKVECVFLTHIIKPRVESKWNDLGHDQSVVAEKFFSLDEIQNSTDVKPDCLKDGRWLQAFSKQRVVYGAG